MGRYPYPAHTVIPAIHIIGLEQCRIALKWEHTQRGMHGEKDGWYLGLPLDLTSFRNQGYYIDERSATHSWGHPKAHSIGNHSCRQLGWEGLHAWHHLRWDPSLIWPTPSRLCVTQYRTITNSQIVICYKNSTHRLNHFLIATGFRNWMNLCNDFWNALDVV